MNEKNTTTISKMKTKIGNEKMYKKSTRAHPG
jgi:hypothetical protein